MRLYIVAVLIASTIIIAGIVFVRSTFGEIESRFEESRRQLKEQQANGTLPDHWKDVDLDALKFTDMQMSLPSNMQIRLDIAMLLTGFSYALAPLTVVACLGVAYFWGGISANRAG